MHSLTRKGSPTCLYSRHLRQMTWRAYSPESRGKPGVSSLGDSGKALIELAE